MAVAASVFGRLRDRPSPPQVEAPASFDVPPAPDPLAASPNARRVVRWCEVADVLERRCQRCHTIPAQAGAPFPLLTFEDTRREFPDGSGVTVAEKMPNVIRHRIMPPTEMPLEPPVQPLERNEVDLLLVWLEEGALPYGGGDCAAKVDVSAATESGRRR